MIDLSKLTPAPWTQDQDWPTNRIYHNCVAVVDAIMDDGTDPSPFLEIKETDRDFIILARNAFDVMMRRGWWSCMWYPEPGYMITVGSCDGNMKFHNWLLHEQKAHEDPFTPWIVAEAWYVGHVESVQEQN